MTKEEILENEQLWKEERDLASLDQLSGKDLRSVGVTPAGMESDIETGQEMADSGLGTGVVDTGAGPASMPVTTPGAGSAGSPAGMTAGA